MSSARIATILACLVGALFQLAVYLYLPAFLVLQSDFGVSSGSIQGTIFIYMVGSAVGQLIGGFFADKYDVKRLFFIATLISMVASIFMAISHSFDGFYILRLVQGIGLGLCMTYMRIILRKVLDGVYLASAFITMSMAFAISAMIAPFIGSQIIEYFSWRIIFISLAVLGGILSYLGLVYLNKIKFDAQPIIGESSSMLKTISSIFINKKFMFNCFGGSIAYGVTISFAALSPYLLIKTLNYTPQAFGYLSLIPPTGYLVGGWWGSRSVVKMGQRFLIKVALWLILSAGIGLALSNVFGLFNGLIIVLFAFIASAGQSILFGNSMGLALSGFGDAKSINYASAIFGFVQSCIMGLFALFCAVVPTSNLYGLAMIFIVISIVCKWLIRVE